MAIDLFKCDPKSFLWCNMFFFSNIGTYWNTSVVNTPCQLLENHCLSIYVRRLVLAPVVISSLGMESLTKFLYLPIKFSVIVLFQDLMMHLKAVSSGLINNSSSLLPLIKVLYAFKAWKLQRVDWKFRWMTAFRKSWALSCWIMGHIGSTNAHSRCQ